MIVDTHSHLYDEVFAEDIDDVLTRAQAAGVSRIFLPNINAQTIAPMLALTREHPGFLYPMLGLHPEDLTDNWRDDLLQMERLLQVPNHPYIAVGEIGLDYYWDRSRYDEQQEAFAIQIRWALRYDLPLMIHTRNAHREMVDVLKNQLANVSTHQPASSSTRGVFHCFAGTVEEAEELLHFDGFMLGIGGVATFKKGHLPEVLRQAVPLERIVVETDSPYLAPTPHRGKRNESSFIKATVAKLADIYETTEANVCEITTRNALQTFPKALQKAL